MVEALKTNSTLVELKYAASHPSPLCQQPLTCLIEILVCSLALNYVGPELGIYMAEALKVNKTLTSVKYAASLLVFAVSSR